MIWTGSYISFFWSQTYIDCLHIKKADKSRMLIEDAMEVDNSQPRIEEEIQFDESKVYQILPFENLLFLLSILN